MRQKKAIDASEYLLWKFAPIEQNTIQHHKINESKVEEIDCFSLQKEILIDGMYFKFNNKQCGSRENKTVVKRIALCKSTNGVYEKVCTIEVGA
jgi:hypothetical protein